MGSDHHAAGDALRILIPPPYAHPVHSRVSCGLSLLPHHADGAKGCRQVHEKPRTDRGGAAARASRAEHEICAGSVSAVARGAERPGVRGSYYEKRAGARDYIAAAVCALVTASYLVLERSMA